ncbi:MAG: SGNH/GDSL hydrolase family protein [Elusimicrobia bacterium]|nr:SGNH/GDSL hydrolase family protein [Elusimicrobiota bacterium]
MMAARRRSRPGLALALASAATLAAAGLAELGGRLLLPSHARALEVYRYAESERGKFCRFSPTLGWDGRPDARASFEWIDSRSFVTQNRHGYRGRAHDYPRTGKPRLLVLGDSYVWGFGAEDGELFTDLIEERLAGRQEVVNLGVSGFGTDQELLLWEEKGGRWRPDHVLLAVDLPTDLTDIGATELYGHQKPAFRLAGAGLRLVNSPVRPELAARALEPKVNAAVRDRWYARLARRSAFLSALLYAASRVDALRPPLQAAGLLPPMRAARPMEYPLYQTPHPPLYDPYFALLERLLARLREDTRRHGARLTVMIVPSPVEVYPDQMRRLVAASPLPPGRSWDPEAAVRRLRELAARAEVPVVDLLPELREAGKTNPSLYFPYNLHWTRFGHRVVAEALIRKLRL